MSLSTNYHAGYSFIELLIVMLILSILVGYGAQFIGSALVGADRRVSIIEMRNIANALFVFKQSGTSTINNFPFSGTLKALNDATQTIAKFPEKNRFEEDYHFTLTPTISVSTTIPQDTHPLGFTSQNVKLQGEVSTVIILGDGTMATSSYLSTKIILTVHYRPKIHQKLYPRLAWVKQFYYNRDASLTLRQTNQGNFGASNILGKFKKSP